MSKINKHFVKLFSAQRHEGLNLGSEERFLWMTLQEEVEDGGLEELA